MQRRLDDLDRCVIANIHRLVDGKWQLRQTESAFVRIDAGTDQLEVWDERVRHVERLVTEAHVDVDVGCWVVCEPAWLEGDGTACYRPVGAIGGSAHATA